MSYSSPFLTVYKNQESRFEFVEESCRQISAKYIKEKQVVQRINAAGPQFLHVVVEKEIEDKIKATKQEIIGRINSGEQPVLRGEKISISFPEKNATTAKVDSFVRDEENDTLQKVYNNLPTLQAKLAYLRYLLHYQHYNAEFTEFESKRLGYPLPLCASQTKPGYFRSNHERLIALLIPWLENNVPKQTRRLLNPNPGDFPFKRVAPITSLAFNIFRMQHTVIQLKNFKNEKYCVVIIPLTRQDLNQSANDLIKNKLGLKNPKTISTLFKISYPDIDCTLAWGGKWSAQTRQFEYCDLGAIFGPDIFSLLRESGTVPDRISVNQFITRGLVPQSFAQNSRLCLPRHQNPLRIGIYTPGPNWSIQIEKIKKFSFHNQPGCALYRDAILQWNNRVFNDPVIRKTALPLLQAEVCPWLEQDSGIVNWSKGYQNLVEVVMFVIDAFPEKFQGVSFETEVAKLLPNATEKKVGLFPYGMTSFYAVMEEIRKLTGKPPKVACISQNYFESLRLLKKMEKHSAIQAEEFSSLTEINFLPDILVADIHPNNAAKKILFQNDVTNWVAHQLNQQQNQPLFLIIDLTLNHLSDLVVQDLFSTLLPNINGGKVHLFGLQSLAKLLQLGGDNLSGGAAFYLGNAPVNFPPSILQKTKFFGLMSLYFDDLTLRYCSLIRQNTELLYSGLQKRFSDMEKFTNFKKTVNGKEVSSYFNAATVKLNTDSETVYVAVDFSPLLNEWGIVNKKHQASVIKQLRITLAQAAAIRGLPLTERQSFGFSLTSISDVDDSIRISVGAEDYAMLQKYADLLCDFNYALSKYVALSLNKNVSRFGNCFLQANDVVRGKQNIISRKFSFNEELGNEFYEQTGEGNISFNQGKVELRIYKKQSLCQVIEDSEKIKIQNPPITHAPKGFYAHALAFHICAFGTENLSLYHEQFYVITGVFGGIYLFSDRTKIEDRGLSIKKREDSEIFIEYNEEKYESHQIFISDPRLGQLPCSWDKIAHSAMGNTILNEFQFHRIERSPGNNLNTLILKRGEKKPQYNYTEEFFQAFREDELKGVYRLIKFWETDWPLSIPYEYDSHSFPMTPQDAVYHGLLAVGQAAYLSIAHSKSLALFNPNQQKILLRGIAQRLLRESWNTDQTLQETDLKILQEFLLKRSDLNFIESSDLSWWVHKLNKKCHQEKLDKESIYPYLPIFLPYLKENYKFLSASNYENPGEKSVYIQLKEISTNLNHPALAEYIHSLEKDAIQNALNANSPETITYYLNLFIHYPFSQDDKERLLTHLKGISQENLKQWLIYPRCYFDALPADHFGYVYVGNPNDIIFFKKDHPLIRQFFDRLECQSILENLKAEYPDAVKNWTQLFA